MSPTSTQKPKRTQKRAASSTCSYTSQMKTSIPNTTSLHTSNNQLQLHWLMKPWKLTLIQTKPALLAPSTLNNQPLFTPIQPPQANKVIIKASLPAARNQLPRHPHTKRKRSALLLPAVHQANYADPA